MLKQYKASDYCKPDLPRPLPHYNPRLYSLVSHQNSTVLNNVCNFTFSAVSHGHFASPRLSNCWTWYCVPWWFFHDMPCAGLQSPLKATAFVSSGACSPLAPLAHLTALCRNKWSAFTNKIQIQSY